jgi:hypothetical protein
VTRCAACGYPILGHETPVSTDEGPKHEHCADPEDVEVAIAAGDYDPAEDYPHGAY